MKWKNEIPNKTEFMKVNSFNFIANEKFNNELEHEKNIGKIVYKLKENENQKKDKAALTSKSLTSMATDSHRGKPEEQIAESRTYNTDTMVETITIDQTETEFQGSAPKRYTMECYFELISVPCWYSELLEIELPSKKSSYSEQVYFKNLLRPIRWSEYMTTEVKTTPKCVLSEITIPVEDLGIHYIALEVRTGNICMTDKSTDL